MGIFHIDGIFWFLHLFEDAALFDSFEGLGFGDFVREFSTFEVVVVFVDLFFFENVAFLTRLIGVEEKNDTEEDDD